MRYFESYSIGDEYTHTGRYIVKEEEIIEFGNRFDPQTFHIDKEQAKNSFFGELVASSVHLFAIAISLGNHVDEELKPAAVSALGFNNMKMIIPSRAGDELKSTEVILKKRLSKSKPGLGIVTFRNLVSNQHDEIAFEFEAAVLIKVKT